MSSLIKLLFLLLVFTCIYLFVGNAMASHVNLNVHTDNYKYDYLVVESHMVSMKCNISTNLLLSMTQATKKTLLLRICTCAVRRFQRTGTAISIAFTTPSLALCSGVLFLVCCGDIQLNPGPQHAVCAMCDKAGRKTQMKLTCFQCNSIFHSKWLNITPGDARLLDNDEWMCWSCSRPCFSDSIFDMSQSVVSENDT
jgi:hypothetical protein